MPVSADIPVTLDSADWRTLANLLVSAPREQQGRAASIRSAIQECLVNGRTLSRPWDRWAELIQLASRLAKHGPEHAVVRQLVVQVGLDPAGRGRE